MAISEVEKTLLTHLGNLYNEGARYREKTTQDWKHSVEVVKGNMWPERRPKYKVSAVMNFLEQVIEKKTALLTDSRPTADVVSRKKGLDEVCGILKKVVDAIFEGINWEQKLVEFVYMEQYFGHCSVNTCFDKALDYGRGDIDVVVLDPRTYVFDPFVTRSYNVGGGEYFCVEMLRPTAYLRDKYGTRADDIKPDFGEGSDISGESLISKIRSFFKGQTPTDSYKSTIPRSIVRDYWIKDRTSKKDGKLIYPTWREVLVAGGCVVEDGTTPYIDGVLPFDSMEWNFNIDSAYGLNEIGKLEQPQLLFNKTLAILIENAILMSNGIWIGDKNALDKEGWARLSNEPGSYVKKNPGTDLRRETGVSVPNGLGETLSMLLNGMEKLSSITEVTEGRRPGQVTSGNAIEALQLAATTAIRLKSRQIESLIQRIGQKLISRIFQYYTEDKVFNMVGDTGGFKQYIYERETLRKLVEGAGLNLLTAHQEFQYRVVPASSLAITKWQKGLLTMQLFQSGIVDDEEVLDSLEYPNRQKILERVNSKKAQGVQPPPQQQKLPKSILRGGNRESGLQEPQIGK